MAFIWKSEFQVSGNNGGSGGAPKVAVNHLGQAIVVWQDGSSVKGHAIDAFGNLTGADFTVASLNTTATLDIDIASLANGDFVVVHEFQFSATDMDVRYARISAAGVPVNPALWRPRAGSRNSTRRWPRRASRTTRTTSPWFMPGRPRGPQTTSSCAR
jgi:hypothetical protein